jgi:3-dehydroquinate dehydratase-2
MHILIIQGPNLNLVGVYSARNKPEARLTLDKINRGIRLSVRNLDNGIKVKIIQSHDLTKVITAIHQNRNWANAIIIAPSSWSSYEYTLKAALEFIDIPVVDIYFSKPYQIFGTAKESIFSSAAVKTITGDPAKVFVKAVQAVVEYLNK